MITPFSSPNLPNTAYAFLFFIIGIIISILGYRSLKYRIESKIALNKMNFLSDFSKAQKNREIIKWFVFIVFIEFMTIPALNYFFGKYGTIFVIYPVYLGYKGVRIINTTFQEVNKVV